MTITPRSVVASVETFRAAGIDLYRVVLKLPDGATVTHRPLKSRSEADALAKRFHGWPGSVVLTKKWTVRP